MMKAWHCCSENVYMGYGLWVMGYGLWVMGYECIPTFYHRHLHECNGVQLCMHDRTL